MEACSMTQKLWWMAFPALLLIAARSAGAPPTPATDSAKGTAAKADCDACPHSQGATKKMQKTHTGTLKFGIGITSNGGLTGSIDCCLCEGAKLKVAALMNQFKTLYQEG